MMFHFVKYVKQNTILRSYFLHSHSICYPLSLYIYVSDVSSYYKDIILKLGGVVETVLSEDVTHLIWSKGKNVKRLKMAQSLGTCVCLFVYVLNAWLYMYVYLYICVFLSAPVRIKRNAY